MGYLILRQIRTSDKEPRTVSVHLPTSKSISNRLLIMRALSGNKINIEGLSDADDTRLLSAAIESTEAEKWLGQAGTALRFATAWAAITPGDRVLKGSERLSERPIRTLIDALRQCDADIEYLDKEDFIPLRIRGKKLVGQHFRIDGSESSQFVSALLLIAPYFSSASLFELDANQVSKPYIDMTVSLMKKAGAQIECHDRQIRVEAKPYSATTIRVEPDWSAAAYFYGLVCLMPEVSILVRGLSAKSVQGDRAVAEIYKNFGVQTEYTSKGALIRNKGLREAPKKINLIRFPDLAQPIAVTACGLKLPLRIEGLQTLRFKETDRIHALQNELAKCGARTKAGNDFLEIVAFDRVDGVPRIKTYDDHRMAMSFTILAAAMDTIEIEAPEVVTKSFPGFWTEVEKLNRFQLTENS